MSANDTRRTLRPHIAFSTGTPDQEQQNRNGSQPDRCRRRRRSHSNCRTSHWDPAWVNWIFSFCLRTLDSLSRLCEGIRWSFEFERAFYTEVSLRTRALLVNPVGLDRMAERTKDRKGRHRECRWRWGEKRGREAGGHRDRWIAGSRVGYPDCPRSGHFPRYA